MKSMWDQAYNQGWMVGSRRGFLLGMVVGFGVAVIVHTLVEVFGG